jgi:hypothetical protein
MRVPPLFFVLAAWTHRVDATEFWDDFTNNLATDLAPVISLFGEQTTKQFLSESVTWTDYFIFAMAPLGMSDSRCQSRPEGSLMLLIAGILTALVSAIRVCGSPSLRAFIGRAQEGAAVIESELCSSTSRNVGELYNNGGIARVFGRPKILEVVLTGDPKSPIETFAQYVDTRQNQEWHAETSRVWDARGWKYRLKKVRPSKPDTALVDNNVFAPNLSLNLGIKRHAPAFDYAAALIAFMLQSAVIAYGAVATYYLRLSKDNQPVKAYGFPLLAASTAALAVGIWLCAFLVGHSTNETFYHRKRPRGRYYKPPTSKLYWLQPGNQTLGDQFFEAFAATRGAEMEVYIKSEKIIQPDSVVKIQMVLSYLVMAIVTLGWVGQFVGLRECHGTISLAQLVATLLVSVIRALLRTQRLRPEDNLLRNLIGVVVGHELDWLAIRMCLDTEVFKDAVPGTDENMPMLHFTPSRHSQISHGPHVTYVSNVAESLLQHRAILAKLTSFPDDDVRLQAMPTRFFDDKTVEMRAESGKLANLMGATLDILFGGLLKLDAEFSETNIITWSFNCTTMPNGEVLEYGALGKPRELHETVALEFRRDRLSGTWKASDVHKIEALLGLWLWSLIGNPNLSASDPHTKVTVSTARKVRNVQILAGNETYVESLRFWCSRSWIPNLVVDPIPTFRSQGGWEMFYPAMAFRDPHLVWRAQVPRPTRELVHAIPYPPKQTNTFTRLFGSYVPEFAMNARGSYLAPKPPPYRVCPASSLNSLCAQEVFGHFLKATIGRVSDIGESTLLVSDQHVEGRNKTANRIVEAFVESGLGTRQEATLCVIPCLIEKLKLRTVDDTVVLATKAVCDCLANGNHTNAERVWGWFRNLYSRGEGRNTQECALLTASICESSRNALRDTATRKLGSDAIDWLLSRLPHLASADMLPRIDFYKRIRDHVLQMEEHDTDLIAAELQKAFRSTGSDSDKVAALLTLYAGRGVGMDYDLFELGLCWCSKGGLLRQLEYLLETRPDSNVANSQYWQCALWHAINHGQIKLAKKLLDRGVSPAMPPYPNKLTPFFLALDRQERDIVSHMISKMSRADLDGRHGVHSGDVGSRQLPPDPGPSNLPPTPPLTALHFAVLKADSDMFNLLLPHMRHHVDVNHFTDLDCILLTLVRNLGVHHSLDAADEASKYTAAARILGEILQQPEVDLNVKSGVDGLGIFDMCRSRRHLAGLFEVLYYVKFLNIGRESDGEQFLDDLMAAVKAKSLESAQETVSRAGHLDWFRNPVAPWRQSGACTDNVRTQPICRRIFYDLRHKSGYNSVWGSRRRIHIKLKAVVLGVLEGGQSDIAELLIDCRLMAPELTRTSNKTMAHWLCANARESAMLQTLFDRFHFWEQLNMVGPLGLTLLSRVILSLSWVSCDKEKLAKSQIFSLLVRRSADIAQAVACIVATDQGVDDTESGGKSTFLHRLAAFGVPALPTIVQYCGDLLEAKDHMGRTPLALSIMSPLGTQSSQALIAIGADQSFPVENKPTPYQDPLSLGRDKVYYCVFDLITGTNESANNPGRMGSWSYPELSVDAAEFQRFAARRLDRYSNVMPVWRANRRFSFQNQFRKDGSTPLAG